MPHPPADDAPDLASYDHIIVAYSGGKDCTAALLHLFELGADPRRIELHHHDVDGGGPAFMDWPCTRSYCSAVASALGLRIYFSYREGGFLREMLRHGEATAAVAFEDHTGVVRRAGGNSDRLGTRLRFPQVSASLTTRWCSPALKIGVMDAVICNQDRFLDRRTLVVTGERAEESASRAHYATFEPHRTDTREGSRRARHVDHWRPVHGWTEAAVWEIIRRHGLAPHVAYSLGWSRLSCAACIFGNAAQWASVRVLFPERFEQIAEYERAFGCTIKRAISIRDLADQGRPYDAVLHQPHLVAQARDDTWRMPVLVPPSHWQLPPGAFSAGGGPP